MSSASIIIDLLCNLSALILSASSLSFQSFSKQTSCSLCSSAVLRFLGLHPNCSPSFSPSESDGSHPAATCSSNCSTASTNICFSSSVSTLHAICSLSSLTAKSLKAITFSQIS